MYELLEEMLDRLGIEKWDLVLIGDGSGSNFDHDCGWACVSIERLTFERRVWFGAMNRGTVNIAEMMAYLQPLSFFAAAEDNRRKESGKPRTLRVHIITDSEYCRSQGESGNPMPNRHGALWGVFEHFERNGISLHWHHILRETVELNRYADLLSKAVRLLVKDAKLQQAVESSGPDLRTVYDYNPTVQSQK